MPAAPPLPPSQLPLSMHLPRKRRANWFVLKAARVNTFLIVNITPYLRDSLEDKSMIAPSKKSLVSSLFLPRKNILGHSFERRAY